MHAGRLESREKKLEMNLTNVARSSLNEARKDYLKHLTRRGLRHWQEGEAVFTEARNLRPKSLRTPDPVELGWP